MKQHTGHSVSPKEPRHPPNHTHTTIPPTNPPTSHFSLTTNHRHHIPLHHLGLAHRRPPRLHRLLARLRQLHAPTHDITVLLRPPTFVQVANGTTIGPPRRPCSRSPSPSTRSDGSPSCSPRLALSSREAKAVSLMQRTVSSL